MKKIIYNFYLSVRLFITSLLFLFTSASLLSYEIASPVYYRSERFDVLHYQALIDLRQAPNSYVNANNKITIYWKEKSDTNKFYFHLRDLVPDSVLFDGVNVGFNLIGEDSSPTQHYVVYCPPNPFDTSIITVYYHGKMTSADNFGGVFSENGMLYSVGVGFRNNYVSTTRHWLACYDLPGDKATFDFTFITPQNITVASNGSLTEDLMIDDNDTFRISRWYSDIPTATNLLTFAAGEFIKTEIQNSEYPIVIYSRSHLEDAVRFSFSKLPEMIKYLEKIYGKYPFEKIGYVITTLSGGAMEHQTMIMMNEAEINKLFALKDSVNETAFHELSHQWFGNSVTPFDYRDAWFNEGFATFSAHLWLEHLFGYKRYLQSTGTQIDYYTGVAVNDEGVLPLYDYPRTSPSSNYPITIYFKGAAVAAMLRYELGDSLFFNSLASFLDNYKYGNTNTEIFKNFLEEYTGKDLTEFFDQWVYRKGYPMLKVTASKKKSDLQDFYKAELTLSQVQPDEWGYFRNVPLDISFTSLDGDRYNKIIYLNEIEQTYQFDSLPNFINPIINRGELLRTLVKVSQVSTSIDDYHVGCNIELYPNPAPSTIRLKCCESMSFSEISIIDILGNKVRKYINDKNLINKELSLEINDLPIGMYILQAKFDNYYKIFNFIKI